MRRLLKPIAATAVVLALAACGGHRAASRTITPVLLRNAVREIAAAGPAMTVAVFQSGRAPVTYSTITKSTADALARPFYGGSLAKETVALMTLNLASEGKIRLDAPVATYVSALGALGRRVTIRELLDQTSQLPDYVGVVPGKATRADVDNAIAHMNSLALIDSPGSRFFYSNTNYYLLSKVISAVEKKTFDTVANTYMRSLSVNAYRFVDGPVPGVVPGRDCLSGKVVKPNIAIARGSGNVVTTVEALGTLDARIMEHVAESGSPMSKIATPAIMIQGRDDGYSYGEYVSNLAGQKIIWHDGLIPGYTSYNGMAPGARTSLAIVAACSPYDVVTLARRLWPYIFGST